MNAIILSAGQGRRLLPYTASLPKCLLPVDGSRSALEVQLRALVACGIKQARVLVGFQAEKVEAFLATDPVGGINVETLYNPFFDSSENLVTAWLARPEMTGDFLLMNGDTLFEPAVLECLLSAPVAPITLVINGKTKYDDDDMKASISSTGRLRAVSKRLDASDVNGESIGLMRFSGSGVEAFRSALDDAVRTQSGRESYYLSIIDQLAQELVVATASMTGLWWGEMDSAEDLKNVRGGFDELRRQRAKNAHAQDRHAREHSHPATRMTPRQASASASARFKRAVSSSG